MAIDPVKIPQNVYIEDRVVGPLTLKQLLIMGIGGGFSYMLYAALAKANGGNLSLVPTILVWIPAAISAIFAIVKINDLSLLRICLLSIEQFNNPSRRVWAPRRGLTIHIRTGGGQTAVQEKTQKQKETLRAEEEASEHRSHRIHELSSFIDRPMEPAEEGHATPEPRTKAGGTAEESLPSPAPAPTEASRAPAFPVDPDRIAVDGAPQDPKTPADLSAYDGVFRDISPHS